MDALLAAASASQAPSAIRTSEKRALDIDGNDLGEMIDKKNFPDEAYNTNTERRMIDSGRWEAFSSKGSTHWAPEKIMAEVRARSIENLPHLSMLSGDSKLVGVWVSTALFKDIKDYLAIKNESKFALFLKFNFTHGTYSSKTSISLSDFGVEPNFDRAAPETAMRSLVKSVKGLELSLACVQSVTYLHSLDFLNDDLNYGKLNLRDVRFVRFQIECTLAKLKRTLSRRAYVNDDTNGAEIRFTSAHQVKELMQKYIREIDWSKESEDIFNQRHAKDLSDERQISTGVEVATKTPATKVGDEEPLKTTSKKKEKADRTRKVKEDALKAASVSTGVTTLTKTKRLKDACILFMAETSGLFPGVGCKFATNCFFEHTKILDIKQDAALAILTKSGNRLENPAGLVQLQKYVQDNCTA